VTATERTQQWRRAQKTQGLCQRCTKPAKRKPSGQPMSLCADHLAIVARYRADRRHGRTPVSTRSVITKDMLLHDIKCVAARLKIRRVSITLYEQEGSFSPKVLLDRRIKQSWSALCVEVGLLPTFRGCRGIDEKVCRCGRRYPVYRGREQDRCWRCRQVARKRTTGAPVEMLGVSVGSERAWRQCVNG
jgi:hypothetical protein